MKHPSVISPNGVVGRSQFSLFIVLGLFVCAISGSDAQNTRAQLDGVWILSGSATIEMTLTPAGEAARARYDYLRDDPAMQCIPASFTRVMHTPSPPIEVRQHKNEVHINYEFMDIRRRVPIAPLAKANVSVSKHPHLGRSAARYEGDVLLIETVGQRAGILDTLGAPGTRAVRPDAHRGALYPRGRSHARGRYPRRSRLLPEAGCNVSISTAAARRDSPLGLHA
jgi:hypothetical protein